MCVCVCVSSTYIYCAPSVGCVKRSLHIMAVFFQNILIIHFGLLLQESILDSNRQDLWINDDIISLLWMKLNSLYFPLLTDTFTYWILLGT